MNIGLFNENFPPIYDGVSITVNNYAYWLCQKGHNACVVTPNVPERDDKAFSFPIYGYFSLPIWGRNPYRLGIPFFDRQLLPQLENLQFDIIHAHTPFSSGNLALKLAKEKNIPIVATFHSKYKTDIERQAPFRFITNHIVKGIVSFFNQVDEVWIPQACVEQTLREYGYHGPVYIMKNGSDFCNMNVPLLRSAGRSELGVRDTDTVLLFVGQHIWEKNIGLILKSLSILKDLPFRLVTVGCGYAFTDIRKMAEELGIGNKVQMLGQISDREQLQRIYAAADLFLFPSLYDTFGLVVREAAALNVPSLLLRGSDASDSITDGVNGFLSDNTPQSFAYTIKYLLENPEATRNAGIKASKTLPSTWENIMNDVVERYSFIIEEKRRKTLLASITK